MIRIASLPASERAQAIVQFAVARTIAGARTQKLPQRCHAIPFAIMASPQFLRAPRGLHADRTRDRPARRFSAAWLAPRQFGIR